MSKPLLAGDQGYWEVWVWLQTLAIYLQIAFSQKYLWKHYIPEDDDYWTEQYISWAKRFKYGK